MESFSSGHLPCDNQALEEIPLGAPRLSLARAAQMFELVLDDSGEDPDVEIVAGQRPGEHLGSTVQIDDAPQTAVWFTHHEGVETPNGFGIRSQFWLDEADWNVGTPGQQPYGAFERPRLGSARRLRLRARDAQGEQETSGRYEGDGVQGSV